MPKINKTLNHTEQYQTYLSWEKQLKQQQKKQLTAHMEKLNALPGDQSAYREFHLTETSLHGIVSDLLEYMDEGKCAILILLDLSPAFDTVDRELLIDDLMYIGVEGVALKWFKSYWKINPTML